jgi:polysaccharide biosynthesis protein PslG
MKTTAAGLILVVVLVADGAMAQLPSATVPNGIGVNTHWCQIPLWDKSAENQFNAIRASGVKFVRDDLVWSGIEQKKGHYDFTYYDAFSNAMAARGIRILWMLGYSNDLYRYHPDPKHPDSAAWRDAFTKYAAAAVDHFKGKGNIYELYNEPNTPFWPTGWQPGQYMALANQAIPEMRKKDPGCTIVAPAVSDIDTTYLDYCFNYAKIQPGRKGLLDLVDAISCHPYRSYPSGPETAASHYGLIRSLMKKYGKTLPIVSSEWGYSTGTKRATSTPAPTAQIQGDYLARMCLVNLSQGIPLTIWYDWKDDFYLTNPPDPTEYEQNFGMTTMHNAAKPAYQEMLRLTRSLGGTTFTSRLSSDPSDWLLVFASLNGHQTLAAWTTVSPHRVSAGSWGSVNLTSTPLYVDPASERPGTGHSHSGASPSGS